MSDPLKDELFDRAMEGDSVAAVALALFDVARQIRNLGNADAATPMGGLEALSVVLKEGMDSIAAAIGEREYP